MSRRSLLSLFVIAVIVMSALSLFAQTQTAPTPAKVIYVVREHVNPGKAVAHQKLEAAWGNAFRRAGVTFASIALETMYTSAEAWFINGFDSYGAQERAFNEQAKRTSFEDIFTEFAPQEAGLLSGTEFFTASYMPGESFQPDFSWGDLRYAYVGIERVPSGFEHEYGDYQQLLTRVRQRSGSPLHVWMYQIDAGARGQQFMWIIPLKSLADIDEIGKSEFSLKFTDEERKQITDLERRTITDVQTFLLRVNPAMSVPTSEIMARAPEFWNPKLVMAKNTEGKLTPSAKKERKATEKK